MGEILTFAPRPKQAAPELPEPVSPAELRAEIEAGAQAALDMADRFIAILDRLDGDPTQKEERAAAARFPAAPESQPALKAEAAAETPPNTEPETAVIQVSPLRWRGRGNIVAAVGVALLDMVGSR